MFHLLASAFRGHLRRPGSSLVIIAMLALGIGASTAVFSLMAPTLFGSMGLRKAGRVIEIFRDTHSTRGGLSSSFEQGMEMEELLAQGEGNPTLTALCQATRNRFVVRAEGGEASLMDGAFISSGYSAVVGVEPALGQGFAPEEDRLPSPHAIISHRLWRRAFAQAPEVLGRTLWVNGAPFTVAGVFPTSFPGHVPGQTLDLWIPMGAQSLLRDGAGKDQAPYRILSSSAPTLGRLKPGVTLPQAEAALRSVGGGFQTVAEPDLTVSPIRVRPFVRERLKFLEDHLPAPWLLLASSGILLLLACANVANLQLARLENRRWEFAVRLAMGARRGAILRQVLAENLLLSVGAGLLGVLVASPILGLLAHLRTVAIYAAPAEHSLSPQAVVFALALGLATTLATGLLPALNATRRDLVTPLKAGTISITNQGTRLKDGLVVLQVALAFALVASSTLIARGLDRARNQDLGFKPQGVDTLRLEFPESWQGGRKTEVLQRIQEHLGQTPGVITTGLARGLPMEEGTTTITMVDKNMVRAYGTGPGFFAALGVPLLKGRDFQPQDGTKAWILNQAAAQRFLPGQDPVGKVINGTPVVGVVADHATSQDLGIHEPVLFSPMSLRYAFRNSACILFRTQGHSEAILPIARHWVQEAYPDLPILKTTTLEAHLDGLYHDLQAASWVMGFCGIASLLLAGMGVQSLLAFRVARQSREIGLRMALGAQRKEVVGRVIRRGMGSVALGLALGSLGAFWIGRVCHGLFRGVDPLEPGSLLVALGVLLASSLLACLGPALRAASVAPSVMLREE